VEPGGVIEADHAGGVAVEVQWPAVDAGPVRGIAEQRGVEVRVVAQRACEAKPVAVRRFAGAVGPKV
jgi:hypothetical protein